MPVHTRHGGRRIGEQLPNARNPRVIFRRTKQPLNINLASSVASHDEIALINNLWTNIIETSENCAERAATHAQVVEQKRNSILRPVVISMLHAAGDVSKETTTTAKEARRSTQPIIVDSLNANAFLRQLRQLTPQNSQCTQSSSGSGRMSSSSMTEDLNQLVEARDYLALHKALTQTTALPNGFNPGLTNSTADGNYPVHVAAQSGDAVSLALLHASGASISSCSRNEQSTPFLMAARCGSLPLLMQIINVTKTIQTNAISNNLRSSSEMAVASPTNIEQVLHTNSSPIFSPPAQPPARKPATKKRKADYRYTTTTRRRKHATPEQYEPPPLAQPVHPDPSPLFPNSNRGYKRKSMFGISSSSHEELFKLFNNHDACGNNVFHCLLTHQSPDAFMYIASEMRAAGFDAAPLLFEQNDCGETPVCVAISQSPYSVETERFVGAPLDASLHARRHFSGLTISEALRYEFGLDIAALQRRGKFCSGGAGASSPSATNTTCVNSPATETINSCTSASSSNFQQHALMNAAAAASPNLLLTSSRQAKLPLNEALRRKLSYTVQHLVEIGCDSLEREKPPLRSSSESDSSAAAEQQACDINNFNTTDGLISPDLLTNADAAQPSLLKPKSTNAYCYSRYSYAFDNTHLQLGCNAFDAAYLDSSFDAMRSLLFPILYADRRVRRVQFPYIFAQSAQNICTYSREKATLAASLLAPRLGVVPTPVVPERSPRDLLLVEEALRLRCRVWLQRNEQIVCRDITHNHGPRPIRALNQVDFWLYPDDARYAAVNAKRWVGGAPFHTILKATCQCTAHGCTTYTCECAGLARRDQFTFGRIPNIASQQHGAFVYECSFLCPCHARQCRNRNAQLLRGDSNIRLELVKTRRKGWGVRTLQPLVAGHLISVMTGMYHDYWDASSNGKYSLTLTSILPREDVGKKYGKDCFANEYVLECIVAGNIGRYFNHSCAPNCEMLPFQNADDWSVPSATCLPTMVLVAKQNIKARNELTWYYSEDYWLSGDFGECQCGMHTCISKKAKRNGGKVLQRQQSTASSNTPPPSSLLPMSLSRSSEQLQTTKSNSNSNDEPATRKKNGNRKGTGRRRVCFNSNDTPSMPNAVNEKRSNVFVDDADDDDGDDEATTSSSDEFNFLEEGDVETINIIPGLLGDFASNNKSRSSSSSAAAVTAMLMTNGPQSGEDDIILSSSSTLRPTSPAALISHVQQTQPSPAPPQAPLLPQMCRYPLCGDRFSSVFALQRHISSAHAAAVADNAVNICLECGDRLKSAVLLLQHAKVHQSPSAYVCKYCGQGFSIHDNLLAHMRCKHSPEHKV